MQAMTHTRYGSPDVLHLADVPTPTPKADEVLVQVHAAGVNPADWHLLHGQPFMVRFSSGLRRPKHPIPGADMAGVVAAVGKDVTRFRPGDAVFGDLSNVGRGAFAEYAAVPADALAAMPSGLTFAQAAAVPMAAVTALQGLRDHGRIEAGQQVLINGASGGVGTFAVQIAKAFDATVTGVASTRKLEMARALGADHVVDYTQEDFTQSGRRYDLIFDTVANHAVDAYRAVLNPSGRFVTTGFLPALALPGPLRGTGGHTMVNMMAQPNPADLDFLAEWLESGQVTPVLDRTFPLTELADALRYVGEGHAKGKVVIAVADEESTQEIAAVEREPALSYATA